MKHSKKMNYLLISGLIVTLLAGCNKNVTQTEEIKPEVETPEVITEVIDEVDEEPVVEETKPLFEGTVVKPDGEFEMHLGEKIMVEGDDNFVLELTDIKYFDDDNTHIVHFNGETPGVNSEVIIFENSEEEKELYNLDYDYVVTGDYIPHTMTVLDVENDYVKISLSDTIIPPEAYTFSGNPDDIVEFDDFQYVETDMAFIYFSKDIKYPGNLPIIIDDIMYALEEETGYSFYPEDVYNDSHTSFTAETYLDCDPWKGVNPYHDKVNIFIFKDDGSMLISNASAKDVVLIKEDFLNDDGTIRNYNTISHELTHILFGINTGECQCRILNEGLAEYYQTEAVLNISDKYEIAEHEKNYTYGLLDNLNANNSETLFIEDYQNDNSRTGEYQYGFFLITYLTDTYGKDTLKEFFDVLNTKHRSNDVYYSDVVCESLKEVYGENVFTDFAKWYSENKSQYDWQW